ncbi:hypothetical protein BDQ12DRAFT_667859 [Crucibulum laeve]|uniref:Uncharacterized protein n=1 Tax=Crucibulum laeve TaxID=68775 RepID=A0A5C3LUJ8_9AGAR|nr:hypothetical protein BDQ12DRAFT_667859 [Crucibulum laeve]
MLPYYSNKRTEYYPETSQAMPLLPRDDEKRNLHLEHYSGVMLTINWINVWFITYIITKGQKQWLQVFPNYSFALLLWDFSVFFIPLIVFSRFRDNELFEYEALKFIIIFTITGLFSDPSPDAQQLAKFIGPVLLWCYSLASCFVTTLTVHNHYVRIIKWGMNWAHITNSYIGLKLAPPTSSGHLHYTTITW